MAVSTVDQVSRLLRGREVQFKAVAITALSSYVGQLIGIWLHWALWAIALATILPWIPLFTMKILWTSKHYGFMAIYLTIMLLQAGHVGEHVIQMLQFIFIYNPAHGCYGFSWYGICKDAHGVFGELDRELVHFVWDGLILIACIVLRIHFWNTKNIWLTLAVIAAAIHQIEHCFLFGTYTFDNHLYTFGGTFLGLHLSAYGVQDGLMGHDGVVGTLTGLNGPINFILPARIPLHFIYNVLVLIPMALAFRQQVRVIYDEWLAKAMPQLTEEQLIAATLQSENVKFGPNQVIFRQGDPADKFYIITKGQVDVLRTDKSGKETQVARLSEGQYFGEIGLLGRTERTATIKTVTAVECLAMSREVFKSLLAASSAAYKDMDVVLRRRLVHLGAIQGLPIQDTVNADPDTILKTRMIRDRLKVLQGDDVSRMLGRGPIHVNPPSPFGPPQMTPMQQGTTAGTMVAERPVETRAPAPSSPLDVPFEEATIVRPPANNGFNRGTLMVRTGPAAGMRYMINAPRIIVGRRSPDTNVDAPMMQIDDARVSRHHMEIFARPDGLYARDLGSANGTWINGSQLRGEPVRLEDGAEILVGPDTTLNYRMN